MKKIPTMTLGELTDELRNLWVKTSTQTVSEFIEQGKYPFAICVRGPGGRRVFEIYRVPFDAWVRDRCVIEEPMEGAP